MASALWNIYRVRELRQRLMVTAGLLAIYRVGIFISLPGVDHVALRRALGDMSGTLFSTINMFSGGAFEQASIFALGVAPYISSSIVMQLLTVVVPTLERLQKEGEAGRRKINTYTRYATVALSLVQGFGVANLLAQGPAGVRVVDEPTLGFFLMTMLTLMAGTMFVMWLGEQITERGLGNGTSLIIFAGIVAQLPGGVMNTIKYLRGEMVQPVALLAMVVLIPLVIAGIIFFEQAQRRIPVQYARRGVAGGSAVGRQSHLPLKINTSGVIPPIFAATILMFPATVASFFKGGFSEQVQQFLRIDSWFYNTSYVLLILFFCYFYTAVTFNPVDVADNLKKYGGFIPGIRPGKKTAEYIDKVLSRITLGGAAYLSAICVLPTLLATRLDMPFRFGGTGLLIVVGVGLDTVRQIESHLITQHYDGFAGRRGPRIRGRR